MGYKMEHSAGESERLLTQKEAASILRLSEKTLEGWRWRGYGPTHISLSRRAVRYRFMDLMHWIEKHSKRSTTNSLV